MQYEFLVERIKRRTTLGRRRHQNLSPFGFNQRERLPWRQRNPLEKLETPLGARPRAKPCD
jgi:hypothetical protein